MLFFESIQVILTLPQDDLAVSDVWTFCVLSEANSSAKPQEQSLHAFRFPVVSQTRR